MSSLEEVLEGHGGAMLSTYLSVLATPHLMGKTHVGDLRAGGQDAMGARVLNMTEEVMATAKTIISDLQSLQDDYVEMHTRQSGELPEAAKKSWGKLHIFSALLQQLKTEVGSEMDEVASKGFATVDDKRKAWEKRLDPEWKKALYANSSIDKTREVHHIAVYKKSSAAASAIQSAWKERRRKKQILKASQDALRHRMASHANAEVSETMENNSKLKARERNELRKEMQLSFRQFQNLDTEYQVDGSLHLADHSKEYQADGSLHLADHRKVVGRISRKVLPMVPESSSSEDEEVQRKPNRRMQKKAKRTVNLNRLAALSAPKKAVDLDELQRKRANAPVWKGSGAFQDKTVSGGKIPGWLRGGEHNTRLNTPAPEPCPKYVPKRWDVVRRTIANETEIKRLARLKVIHVGAPEQLMKIQAPNSMRLRMQRALKNFEAFGASLDNWVKENQHVLKMMVEDCNNPGRADTPDSNTSKHKELVGHQLMVMSSMFGVLKQNVMAAQEAILGYNPALQEAAKFTREEMKDGTATIMKMWREISDTANPLQVALGNLDPKMMIALMMKKAEKDHRDTKDKAQEGSDAVSRKMKGLEAENSMTGLLTMFASDQNRSMQLPESERVHEPAERRQVQARYLQPKKLYINSSQVQATPGSSLLSPAGKPLGPREAQQKSFRLAWESKANNGTGVSPRPSTPPGPAPPATDLLTDSKSSPKPSPCEAEPQVTAQAEPTQPQPLSTRQIYVPQGTAGPSPLSVDMRSRNRQETQAGEQQPRPQAAPVVPSGPRRPSVQLTEPQPLPLASLQSITLHTKSRNYSGKSSTSARGAEPNDSSHSHGASPALSAIAPESSQLSIGETEEMAPEVKPLLPGGSLPPPLSLDRLREDSSPAERPLTASELLLLQQQQQGGGDGHLPQLAPTDERNAAAGAPTRGRGQDLQRPGGQGSSLSARGSATGAVSLSGPEAALAHPSSQYQPPTRRAGAARAQGPAEQLRSDGEVRLPGGGQGQQRSTAPLPALAGTDRDARISSLLAECDSTIPKPEDIERRKIAQILIATRADQGYAAGGGRFGVVKTQTKSEPGAHRQRKEVQPRGHVREEVSTAGTTAADGADRVVPYTKLGYLAPVMNGQARTARQGFQVQQPRLPYQAQSRLGAEHSVHHEPRPPREQHNLPAAHVAPRPKTVSATSAKKGDVPLEPNRMHPPEPRPHSIPGSLGPLKGHKTRAPIGGTAAGRIATRPATRQSLPSVHAWVQERAGKSVRATVPPPGSGFGVTAAHGPWNSGFVNHSAGGIHRFPGAAALSAA